jgi:hypothetical protein
MWYSTKLVFRSLLTHEDGRHLQEESIRLFRAESSEEAARKAIEFAKKEEVAYPNEAGEVVRWIFVAVDEVQELADSAFADGVEVFSIMKWIDKND